MPARDLRIGITLGDPAGIGPEIILKALKARELRAAVPVVIGRADVLARCDTSSAGMLSPAGELALRGALPYGKEGFLFEVGSPHPVPEPGTGSVRTGEESLACVDAAVGLWKKGLIDAVVTAPVSKSFVEKTGRAFTGHTEYLADAIGERDPFMMMYSPRYRVILTTTHLPLARVTSSIDEERIVRTIETAHRALTAIDGKKARVAVAGLDPHCGDDGAIGDFDARVTTKAVARARELGIDVEGPFAADTLFLPGRWERYSVAVAQYHDQGLIPFKALAFDTGVNVTLGLSMMRTSVDHGTAYDIAGKGIAKHSSLVEAFTLAARLAEGGRHGAGS